MPLTQLPTNPRRHAGSRAWKARGKLRDDADPAEFATAAMASIQGGLLLTQARRDPRQLRISLDAARVHLRLAAACHQRSTEPERERR